MAPWIYGIVLGLLSLVGLFMASRAHDPMLYAVGLVATVVAHRAPGLTLMRLPFFVWSQVVTALLLLLAFPALQAAAVFQLLDRVAGTSVFLPSGLAVSNVTGILGGNQVKVTEMLEIL